MNTKISYQILAAEQNYLGFKFNKNDSYFAHLALELSLQKGRGGGPRKLQANPWKDDGTVHLGSYL